MARAAHYHGSVSSHVVAGGTEILALDGEFDASNAGDFERRLSEASEPERTDILLDLPPSASLPHSRPAPRALRVHWPRRSSPTWPAVTEIATLRADLSDPQVG
jgi:hypothetical protein